MAWAAAGAALAAGPVFRFASVEEGQRILAQRDDFVASLSAFDRQARLKTDQPVGEAQFLAFVGRNVEAWTPAEQALVEGVIREVQPALDALGLDGLQIDVVKTTGLEEGNAPYSRGSAIMIPVSKLPRGAGFLRQVIPHEVFHVLSRRDPQLRKALYATIGFTPCGPVQLPLALRDRRITNPDAPVIDSCIALTAAGKLVRAAPVLYSSADRYDVAKGGEMFAYLVFRFLVVEGEAPGALLDPKEVKGFLEQVGNNTQYLIHPEEILADNFMHLVLGKKDLPTPAVAERLRETLLAARRR